MKEILEIAEKNQKRAYEVIHDSDVVACWESIGAEVNLVGSLKMGLLVTHKDIDFHIYTDRLDVSESFKAISLFVTKNPDIVHLDYTNLANTDEVCLEWHAWYKDKDSEVWQLDMIQILKGSRYDGYFEKMAERIVEVMTPSQKETIMKLKYETPHTEKIFGVEYYQAVIRDGVGNIDELLDWHKKNSDGGIIEWIP